VEDKDDCLSSSETGILSPDDGGAGDQAGDGSGDSVAVEKELEWDSLRSCMGWAAAAGSLISAVIVVSREVVTGDDYQVVHSVLD
jgi:hypothetical protein